MRVVALWWGCTRVVTCTCHSKPQGEAPKVVKYFGACLRIAGVPRLSGCRWLAQPSHGSSSSTTNTTTTTDNNNRGHLTKSNVRHASNGTDLLLVAAAEHRPRRLRCRPAHVRLELALTLTGTITATITIVIIVIAVVRHCRRHLRRRARHP